MERIDKVLASQNYGSRKQVHKLIKSGSVQINGSFCTKIDTKINPETDLIEVDGKKVRYSRFLYIMLNKPRGVVSASRDKNAKTVLDLLPAEYKRKGIFPAGRLDKDTEGLILITDDGEFAHKMLSPSQKVYKTYYARLDGEVTQEAVSRFRQGILFEDGTQCLPARLTVCTDKHSAYVQICEGKFHQVKKMFCACGLHVSYLKRLAVGGLKLDEALRPGESKILSECEKQLIFVVNMH